ncbi:MAG: hypothetical protein IPJ30_14590 [Acidobacteria bacterium]|nr:hypothetical protein [Acidobacteriota bacterium]
MLLSLPARSETDLIATEGRTGELFDARSDRGRRYTRETVVRGLESGNFLILPHRKLPDYIVNKATDYDRWLRTRQQDAAQDLRRARG